jgi:hypothetical protein
VRQDLQESYALKLSQIRRAKPTADRKGVAISKVISGSISVAEMANERYNKCSLFISRRPIL